MADLQTSTFITTNCADYLHDIFINHRGSDVKNTFASHLYYRLRSHGLHPFFDREELKAGELLSPQIRGAITTASIHIAILSPGYADSRWCLDELLLILEKSGDTIIPIFYNVTPSEVRWTEKDGRYARALNNLQEKGRYDPGKLETWRKALKQVSYRVGFELKTYNGDEGKLSDEVVRCVLKKGRKIGLNVDRYPTGLQEKVEDFEITVSLQLRQTGEVKVLGNAGMGELSKKAPAKRVFDEKSSNYVHGQVEEGTPIRANTISQRKFALRGGPFKLNRWMRRLIAQVKTPPDNPLNVLADIEFPPDDPLNVLADIEFGGRLFNWKTLKAATENFRHDNLLGEGGFGAVYKGTTQDGREIAVKKLSCRSQQGESEFLAEVNTLFKIQHPNLVNLLGCCVEHSESMLVYEYLPNKSLDRILFDPNKRQMLDWQRRYNIIMGITRGLLYLHEDCRPRIIHRDIKASNILLDLELNPKISDLGLAKAFPEDETHVSTMIAGTRGYIAPEYAMHGRLSEKADVYSFGVLLLELIAGRKNMDNNLLVEEQILLEWVWRLYGEDNIEQMIDPLVIDTCDDPLMLGRFIHVGLLCTELDSSLRPSMSTTISMLLNPFKELPDPRKHALVRDEYKNDSTGSGSMDSLI